MSTYDQHLEEHRQLERHTGDPDGESESDLERRAIAAAYTRGTLAMRKQIVEDFRNAAKGSGTNAERVKFCNAAAHWVETAFLLTTDPTGGEHQAPESFTGEIVQAGDYAGGSHDSPCVVLLTTEAQLSAIHQNLIGAKVRVTIQP